MKNRGWRLIRQKSVSCIPRNTLQKRTDVNKGARTGILTEMGTKGNMVDFVVIGVGINANINLDSFPKHLRKFLTSLKEELREDADRKRFLCALLEELEQCYKTFTREGFDSILEEKGLCQLPRHTCGSSNSQ